MNILDLPPNVTLLIFSYLNQRDIVCGVRQTCTPWCLLSYERALWRTINLSKFRDASFTSDSFLKLLSSVADSVEHLFLDLQQLTRRGLVHSDIVCPNLKELHFYRSSKSELKHYTGSFPDLEQFSESTELQSCLPELSEKYPCLKSLHLLGHVISIEYLQTVFPELEEIEIECCNLSAPASKIWVQTFFDNHKCIQRIGIRFSVVSSESLSVIFNEVPDVVCLDLSNTNFSHDINPAEVSFKSIERLILDNTQCDDAMLGIIVKDATNLKHVSIGDCTNVTNNGLDHLADNCPNLETLIVNEFEYSSSNITDSGLHRIASSCKKLKVLKVNFCSGIRDIGVQAIAESCPYLQQIEIAGCTALTDASVVSIVKNCQRLQILNLGQCVQLTSKCANLIFKHCRCLVYLNLETCHRITCIRFQEESLAIKLENKETCASELPQKTLADSKGSLSVAAVDDGATASSTFDFSEAAVDDGATASSTFDFSDSLDAMSKATIDDSLETHEAAVDEIEIDLFETAKEVDAFYKNVGVEIREDSGLEDLRLHSHVQTLILRFCSQLSNNCVKQISRICPDLRRLDLCGCSMVTNAGILELVRNCRYLSTLIISGGSVFQTSRLTDACLHGIAEHCQHLETLIIVKNHNITIEGVFEVIRRCPSIAHISVEVSKRANIKPECLTNIANEVKGKLISVKYVGSSADICISQNVEVRYLLAKPPVVQSDS